MGPAPLPKRQKLGSACLPISTTRSALKLSLWYSSKTLLDSNDLGPRGGSPRPSFVGDEALVINTRLHELERRQQEEKEEQRRYARSQDRFNHALAIMLVLATMASVFVLVWQVRVGQKSADAALAAAHAAKRSADIAQAGLLQQKEALAATLADNTAALEKTLNQNQHALNLTLAQQKKALQSTVKLTQIDQRPWVTVSHFVLSSEPEEGKEIHVTTWLKNTGRTPGLKVMFRSMTFLWDEPPKLTAFTFPTIAVDRDLGSTSIFAPQSAVDYWFNSDPWIIPSAASIADYKSGKLKLYIHAAAQYYDVQGDLHLTKLCAWHDFGTSAEHFVNCRTGNDMN